MSQKFKIVGISGSLREGSLNTATLRAAQELAPTSLDIEIAQLADVPMFNEDVEAKGWPAPVGALRRAVGSADGLLMASPEYNHSVTGALKNAIDWLSRPTGKGPIIGKPLAIVGASPSMIGTARSQLHLRQVASCLQMRVFPTAEVLISQANQKFDDNGRLHDEATQDFLSKMLAGYADWITKLKKDP